MKFRPFVAAALCVAMLGACGNDGDDPKSAAPTPQDKAFCDKILPVVWSGDQAKFDEVSKDPPEGFDPKDDKSVVAWVEGHCYPNIAPDAAPADLRLAPTRGADLDGLVTCLAATPPPPAAENPPIVIYGKGEDPYDGEMLGIVTGGGNHAGDGEQIAVQVRGVEGRLAPITVFQQVVVKRLGTVLAWTENGVNYGLYGRMYDNRDANRMGKLVEFANKLQLVGGKMQLPKEALDGYREVFSGSAISLPLINPFSGTYAVELREPSGGLVSISGRVVTDEEYEAFRIFALDIRHEEVGGHDALVGYPWDNDGFAIVQWREESGLMVRLFSTKLRLERLVDVAKKTKALTLSQWADLAQIPSSCDALN